MKPLAEQDHYEVLEVPRNSSPGSIERAYRLAQATYAEDSLAGYSLFEEEGAGEIRQRVETAYRVLSNHESRQAYDALLAATDPGDSKRAGAPVGATLPAQPVASIDSFEEIDDGSADLDGPRLRRARLRRGMDLEDVASGTRISTSYLRLIEEERFTELPARVYVRGFVGAFASYVGLDPHDASAAYMTRYDEARPSRRRRPADRL
jgi:curved DNA-binding protein CbpA